MNYPPEMIGVGKYSGELALYLQRGGHRVEVVAAHPHYPGFATNVARPFAYARTVEAGIRVTRCPLVLREGGRGVWRLIAPLSFAITAAPILVWRILKTRPDLVLSVEPTLFCAPATLAAAWLVGARTALHVQDLEVDAAFATGHLRGGRLRTLASRLERAVLRRFTAVVTISDAMAERLADKGVGRHRLSVARNWIDASPRDHEPGPTRAHFGIAADRRVLLYAGSLGAKQGIPTLLAALRHLAARTDVQIMIAGAGPLAGAVMAAKASIPNLITLPLQPAADLAALLALADVHVLPQDGAAADLVFPSKLGPMLATGRPVVVAANPGTELACWLKGAATVVAADDPAALSEALTEALAGRTTFDPDRRDALVATLDARTVLPAFEAALGRALEGPRRPGAFDRPRLVDGLRATRQALLGWGLAARTAAASVHRGE